MSEEEKEVQEETQPSEVEKRATRMGWRPKDEFKGDPDKWIDAESFVGRTEKELPIALGTIRNLERRLAETDATIKEFAGLYKKSEQKAYERALRDLQKQQREAVEVGDTAKFDAVQQQISEVIRDKRRDQEQTAPAGPNPEFETWKAKNSWYGNDPDMTRVADDISRSVVAAYPELVGSNGIFDRYDEALKLRFGDKLGNPKRKEAPAVASGSNDGAPASSGSGKRSFASLPPEAKAACDKFVKAGLLTRDDYLRDYDWD